MDKAKFLKSLERVKQRTGEQLTSKASGLERVLEISRRIATLELDTALELIVQHILELTGAQRGMVMLTDDRGRLRLSFGIGLNQEEVDSGQFEFSRSVTQTAMVENRVMVVENAPVSSFKQQESIARLGLHALMAIPLVGREQTIGVIYVDTSAASHQMAVEDVSVFSAFGSQAAIAIENARLHRKVREEYLFFTEPPVPHRFDMIVYQARSMQRVRQAIEQVLDNDITVLVQGESGTGKELVAHAIHFKGNRNQHKFVAQNTASLPDSLLESELFGHRRGAFSGAVADKPGLFEIADGGSVFLDEIGEASAAMQVRLLRFLETGTFRRIGDTLERRADVRIITATHRDLREEVAEGRFREDLFYRLSVFPITLPPLRERREDIPLLVNHFVEDLNQKLGKSIHMISKQIMKRLEERAWQGNIRELKNFIYRMMVLSPRDELVWPEINVEAQGQDHVEDDDFEDDLNLKTLNEMERDYIQFVLNKLQGNQSRAARVLGLKRTTLLSRMKKLGISPSHGQ